MLLESKQPIREDSRAVLKWSDCNILNDGFYNRWRVAGPHCKSFSACLRKTWFLYRINFCIQVLWKRTIRIYKWKQDSSYIFQIKKFQSKPMLISVPRRKMCMTCFNEQHDMRHQWQPWDGLHLHITSFCHQP